MCKVLLTFCVECHRIKKIGKWVKIDKTIDMELRKKFGKWEAILTTCSDCSDVEVDGC